MKKLLSVIGIIVISITLTSCSKNSVNSEIIEDNYRVIVIDECEYIIFDRSEGYAGYGFMAHKGNCKNPIHKCN